MRAPGAMFNTHIRTTKGITTTEGEFMKWERYELCFTSDAIGGTLSVGNGKVQFTLKYSEVEKLIEETRADRRTSHEAC